MQFSDPVLQAALEAWRQNPDVRERACSDNLSFEERVAPSRVATFEAEAKGAVTPEDLRRRQIDYWDIFVKVSGDVPHSFQDDLGPADLGSAVIDEYQPIVRLEMLWRPLVAWGQPFETLKEAFERRDTPVLRDFLNRWNDKRDDRPIFAAWRDQVLEEIAASDWPERLRDRMGLAHFNDQVHPIPVALMQYTPRIVKAEAGGVTAMFVAPTALDTEPWPQFFPAPHDAPYGRAMALTPVTHENRLLAEMLHSRIEYRPDHIAALGLIQAPFVPHDLKDLRNTHLTTVRVATGRYDFGEEIP